MKFLLNLKSNLTSPRISMTNVTLKYSKKTMIFWDIFVFESQEKVFSAIFHFVLNFRDFSVFSLSRKTCHSSFTCYLGAWYSYSVDVLVWVLQKHCSYRTRAAQFYFCVRTSAVTVQQSTALLAIVILLCSFTTLLPFLMKPHECGMKCQLNLQFC